MSKKEKDTDMSPYTERRTAGTIFGEKLRAEKTRRADGSMLIPPPLRGKRREIVVEAEIGYTSLYRDGR